MEPTTGAGPSEAAAVLLGLGAATLTALSLAEQFWSIPGAVIAFLAAHPIVRRG